MVFLAHIAEDGRTQSVEEHLRGSADDCKRFAAEFNAAEQGLLAGMMHDIGKYSEDFQRRILHGGAKVDHSTAGAFECMKRGQPYAAFCIAGHHGGLPDRGSRTDSGDIATLNGRIRRAIEGRLPSCDIWQTEVEFPPAELPHIGEKDLLAQDFYTRMLYSCLTDADFLDTERFMCDSEAKRDGGECIEILAEKLDSYIGRWYPPEGEINRQRCAILSRCVKRGDDEMTMPGLFTLTVPTGAGKTVASLAFALHHAKTHGKRRIVYVIPYTSIIEQTAKTFREILGDENVLEHHSGVLCDEGDEATPETMKMMRATENWDKPVIVTTAVQFFESIYANRSSKCRKLHNLANSVIIFDEAQMLPLVHIRPCVSAIAQLAGHYMVSAVLCTATQPALDGLVREFLPDAGIVELCPSSEYDADQFRRVTFAKQGVISWREMAERMREAKQSLCIVNTRKSAKDLYAQLSGAEGAYHLSTLMVPAHRRATLEQIRERLKNDLPCLVVSTSLIEAGVDVDFPAVFREIAGLDAVLQAAGRCNREGKRSPVDSVVTVFQSEQAIPPLFERNVDVGKEVLKSFPDFSTEEAISFYFKKLLLLTGEAAQDKTGILEKIQSGTFPFATIAKEFHMIESDTRTVYIPWERGAELIERMKRGECSRILFREAAQYSVSLYEKTFCRLVDGGYILPIGNHQELWYLGDEKLYDAKCGISLDEDAGQVLFV